MVGTAEAELDDDARSVVEWLEALWEAARAHMTSAEFARLLPYIFIAAVWAAMIGTLILLMTGKQSRELTAGLSSTAFGVAETATRKQREKVVERWTHNDEAEAT